MPIGISSGGAIIAIIAVIVMYSYCARTHLLVDRRVNHHPIEGVRALSELIVVLEREADPGGLEHVCGWSGDAPTLSAEDLVWLWAFE
jgi:hypothetical protein